MLIKKTAPLLAALATGGIAVALTIALGATAPVARASTRTVCCFRITVKVSGTAYGDYQKFEMNADQGRYQYDWDGAAFGLAHLQSGILVTDRGVGVGSLVETNQVVDYAGRPKDGDQAGCSQG